MKELLQVWGRVAGRTYSAVGRNEDSTPPKQRKNNERIRRIITLLSLSVTSLTIGLMIFFLHPYDRLFDWKITLGPGGEIFELWKKPAVDLYLRVYLFNVTNAEEFMKNGGVMKVNQVGPYVYKELMEHGNVEFNDNGTLSGIPLHPLQWRPELSYPHTQEDILFLPNIAMLSIAHMMKDSNPFTRMALNALLRTTGSKPLLQMTAWDFMFGHSSTLVTLGNSFLPGWIKFDKLGLIDRMYDFDGDFETVYTGNDGFPNRSGLLDTWRGERYLSHWDGECGNIHLASDGVKFPGDLKDDQDVLFYRKSLCRPATLVKTGERSFDGIWGFEYSFHNDTLDNGARDERNQCYCRKGVCLPDGLIDVTDCYYGFPIALSYPHFLNSSERLGHRVEGMTPDPKLHGSYFVLQPRSGLPLSVAARFQINIALHADMSSMHLLKHFSNMTVPLLWFEIRMFSLPEKLNNLFKMYLNVLPTAESVIMWLLLIGGPVIMLYLLYISAASKSKSASKLEYNPRRRSLSYANRIRKMSLDIEAKLQGVYAPCEIPLDARESAAPFLDSADLTTDSDEREPQVSEERRPSLIKTQVDKVIDLSKNFSDRMHDNIEGLRNNIKNLTNRLNLSDKALDSDDANQNDGFSSESCQSGGEEDGVYRRIMSSDEETCQVEIMDDGSEFDAPLDAHRRRQSIEIAMMEKRMNNLETGSNQETEQHTVAKDSLARLPYLPEEQV